MKFFLLAFAFLFLVAIAAAVTNFLTLHEVSVIDREIEARDIENAEIHHGFYLEL
jgi:hypothetical protein